jgi:hypothetical protein
MRLLFALTRLILLLPFSPFIVLIFVLAAVDLDDFLDNLRTFMWSY